MFLMPVHFGNDAWLRYCGYRTEKCKATRQYGSYNYIILAWDHVAWRLEDGDTNISQLEFDF